MLELISGSDAFFVAFGRSVLLDQHFSVFGRMDRTSGSRGDGRLVGSLFNLFHHFPKFGLWNTKECLVHTLRRSLARISNKERATTALPITNQHRGGG
jgi:hypothetical protein